MTQIHSSRRRKERGASTTSVLIFASALAISSAALMSQIKDSKKFSKQESDADVERRVNEAALQAVTQLVTTGSILYNPSCNIAEPQLVGGDSTIKYKRDGGGSGECAGLIQPEVRGELACGGAVAWKYERRAPEKHIKCGQGQSSCAVVDVCVPIQEKDVNGKSVQKQTVVTVSFVDYDKDKQASGDAKKVERNFGYLRAQRKGLNTSLRPFAALNAKVNFGATADANRGLLGKHAAIDTCFYMRPKTEKQGFGSYLGFAARTEGREYQLQDLEPRPEGTLADEFRQPVYLDKITANVTQEDYAVLSEYRDALVNDYMGQGQRGPRPVRDQWSPTENRWVPSERGLYRSQGRVLQHFDYSQDRANKQYVGVMPKGENGGPIFKYFLTGNKSKPREWDTNQIANYQDGCRRSAKGGPNSSFCTKVDIPFKEHKATFSSRCKPAMRSESIEPVQPGERPTRRYADLTVQVSCNPAWLQRVSELLRAEHSALGNTEDMMSRDARSRETTADMAIAAIEVDDDFLAGTGRWAVNPMGGAGIHPIRAAFNEFRDALANSGSGVSVVGNHTVVYEGPVCTPGAKPEDPPECPPARTFQFRELESLSQQVVAPGHTSRACSYFIYEFAEKPAQCRFDIKTDDEYGYVCRNNDGCFDEQTFIRMADGSDRLVTRLKKGEFVFNPVTGKPARIVKLTIGPELKPLLHVRVGERTVRVTDSHPFMTRRGWVQAKHLKKTDEVLSSGTAYLPVTSISLGESGRTVANLALEGPADQPELHYVLADGVVTGDLVIQNMLELKASYK